MRQQLISLGAVGNCLDIVDAVAAVNAAATENVFEVIGFLDDDTAMQGQTVYGLPVLGPLAAACDIGEAQFVNGIGGPRSHAAKPALLDSLGLAPDRFATVIHPGAAISPSATIGAGTVLLASVAICANVRVGEHVMMLPNCVVGHDSVIGACSIAAAGVTVSGNVDIGRACYLGAGSVIRDGQRMGAGSLLGQGAVLVDDMPEAAVYVGNPARPLQRTAAGNPA